MSGATTSRRLVCNGIALLAVVAVMSVAPRAQSSQRPYPVVALTCGSDLGLCRALVQALSEMDSSHLYRINPTPPPPQAFDLRLELHQNGTAQLSWADGAQGDPVTRAGLSDTDLARTLVAASPALASALASRP